MFAPEICELPNGGSIKLFQTKCHIFNITFFYNYTKTLLIYENHL